MRYLTVSKLGGERREEKGDKFASELSQNEYYESMGKVPPVQVMLRDRDSARERERYLKRSIRGKAMLK